MNLPKLPPLENKMENFHIDATPKGYALRILKAYRRRCDEYWVVNGLSDNEKLLYDAMNQHQVDRAKELDRAINILEKARIDRND